MVNCDGDDELIGAFMIESGSGDDIDLVKSLSSGVVKQSDELLNEPAGDNSMILWFLREKKKGKRWNQKITQNFFIYKYYRRTGKRRRRGQ